MATKKAAQKKAAQKQSVAQKTIADLSEAEVRALLEDVVLSIREGKALLTANEIYQSIEDSLEKAGLDVSEKMPEGWDD